MTENCLKVNFWNDLLFKKSATYTSLNFSRFKKSEFLKIFKSRNFQQFDWVFFGNFHSFLIIFIKFSTMIVNFTVFLKYFYWLVKYFLILMKFLMIFLCILTIPLPIFVKSLAILTTFSTNCTIFWLFMVFLMIFIRVFTILNKICNYFQDFSNIFTIFPIIFMWISNKQFLWFFRSFLS